MKSYSLILDLYFATITRYRFTPKWRWRKRRQLWQTILDLETELDKC